MQFPIRTRLFRLLLGFVILAGYCSAALAAGIVTSPNDSRHFDTYVLPNKLRVLLVSDPDADKAAASLAVNVGHFYDPRDREGLAHFLEHMLFLGTKKYPDASEYHDFILSHGGQDNAYTDQETTNFFFYVDSADLDEALDRFAQFFISPLFDKQFVGREKNAVDSEYKLKINEDNRRILEVLKATANSEHPFSKFAVGNLDTLADRQDSKVRDDLVSFYRKYYSANQMALAVLGKESIAELKKMVSSRFGKIPDRNTRPLDVKVPLFTPRQRGIRIDIVPLKKQQELTLSFPMPWEKRFFVDKPTLLLSSLIGDEGHGSLLALLKARGWANALSAGPGIVANDAMTFDIDIDLTEEGRSHIDDIVTLAFKYIKLLRQQGLEAWRVDEMRQLQELDFRFREKAPASSEALSLAQNLLNYPARLALKGPYLVTDFDRKTTASLATLLRPDNMRLIVVDQDLDTDQVEPLYQTAYRVQPLKKSQLAKWDNPDISGALALPEKNPYIPASTTIKKRELDASLPQRIVRKPGLEVWHMKDNEFHVPTTDFTAAFETPVAGDTITDSILADLYTALVTDALNETAYPARLAGLQYSVTAGLYGIGFSVSGYDDKQPVLIDQILDRMLNLKVDPERFRINKEEMIRNWQNSHLDRPYQQDSRALGILLRPGRWMPDSLLAAIEPLQPKDLENFIPRLFSRLYIRTFAHGNITAGESRRLGEDIAGRVFAIADRGTPLPRSGVRLAQGQTENYRLDIDHDDSSIMVYYQADSDDMPTRARSAMLAQLLNGPFFNLLRTQQQLGYVVYAGETDMFRLPGITFTIQSPVKGPGELASRIDDFIRGFAETLAKMPESEFDQNRDGLLSQLLKSDERLSERTHRYQYDLGLHYYGFDSRQQLAEQVRRLTPADISRFYRSLLVQPDNIRRLTLFNVGHQHAGSSLPPGKPINDIETFKRTQPAYILPDETPATAGTGNAPPVTLPAQHG